jgi:predicted O-methyltransferase YrrM
MSNELADWQRDPSVTPDARYVDREQQRIAHPTKAHLDERSTPTKREMKKIQREMLRFLRRRSYHLGERLQRRGSSSSAEELLSLVRTAKRTGARLIGEIGFNVGFSSYAFLTAHPETRIVSFDLAEHAWTKAAKELIDERFPGRHTLVYGDSRETVPEFKQRNPAVSFDLVFIDGGHDYEVAKADILNMRSLCEEKTVVIMDDLVPSRPWGVGPTQAWTEAIQDGVVCQDELFKNGIGMRRSWAVGRYLFSGPS